MGKKKGTYYQILGKAGSSLYQLGYTSSKTAATKYYMEQGWKKKDLVFREKQLKKKSPPKTKKRRK